MSVSLRLIHRTAQKPNNIKMNTIYAPDDVRGQAKSIIKLFTENADLKVKVGTTTYTGETIAALDADVSTADTRVDDKRAELTSLLNERNDKASLLNTVVVQGRKAVAGYFGENSNEYELAGGTPLDKRKSPGRRNPAPKPPKA